MRSTFAGALAFATTAFAHYNFEKLIVNDNVTGIYEFVRQTNNSNSPVTSVNSSDFICNSGGLDAATMAKTSTYSVAPGDSVGFTIDASISHPGPLAVYLSKAPDGTAANAYDGSGDWFKVYELSTSSITAEGLQWATYTNGGINNFTFALPSTLAAGDYLMRAEHTALHAAEAVGGAQFYIGCAQLTVTGSGAGVPSPTVSIPGVYTGDEAGLVINIYYPIPTSYTVAGPATWPSACEDHTANFEGQTSDGDCTGDDSTSAASGTAAVSTSAATSTALASTSTAAATTTGAASAATSSAAAASAAEPETSSASSATASAAKASSTSSCSSKKRRAARRA